MPNAEGIVKGMFAKSSQVLNRNNNGSTLTAMAHSIMSVASMTGVPASVAYRPAFRSCTLRTTQIVTNNINQIALNKGCGILFVSLCLMPILYVQAVLRQAVMF